MANSPQPNIVVNVTIPPKEKAWYKIDLSLCLTIFIPAALTVMGWSYANSLEAKRDRENKLRDIKIQYDIEAYNAMNAALATSWHNDSTLNNKVFESLDAAFTRIQLLGSDSQIAFVHNLIDKFIARKNDIDADTLMNSLRYDLRTELNIPPTDIPMKRVANY
jgi:hypothetical protein